MTKKKDARRRVLKKGPTKGAGPTGAVHPLPAVLNAQPRPAPSASCTRPTLLRPSPLCPTPPHEALPLSIELTAPRTQLAPRRPAALPRLRAVAPHKRALSPGF